MANSGHAKDATHPIAVVGRRTGLSPDVLRVWERRYGAVSPVRTETGRRLYSDEDLARLEMLRYVTRAGRRIGDVAALSTSDLCALVEDDRTHEPDPEQEATDPAGCAACLRDATVAVERLDASDLHAVLSRALVSLRVPEFIEQVVAPLLTEIGSRWARGSISPVQERVATGVIRQVLIDTLATIPAPPRARRLTIATPSQQMHDLGAYLAALAAAAAGWRVTVLGADLPAADIAMAANRSGDEAVALSIVLPDESGGVDDELRLLRQELNDRVRILVGGRGAAFHRKTVQEVGGEVLTDTRVFCEWIDR